MGVVVGGSCESVVGMGVVVRVDEVVGNTGVSVGDDVRVDRTGVWVGGTDIA